MAKYQDVLELVDKVSEPLKKMQTAMNKVADTSKALNQKMQKLNDVSLKYATVSRKVLGSVGNLAKAFIGLFTAGGVIGVAINKVTEFGDTIDKMSQKIGMATDSYQEWDYIMSQNGGSVDSLQMGYKTLATQMNNVKKGSKESIKAFKQLGVSVTKNNGAFRTQEEVFNDVVKALQNEKNETKKAILGNQLFGRSFIDMKPLLNQTSEATEALRQKAHDLGLILSKEDIKASVDFKDTMDTLTRFMQAQMNKAIVPLIPKLQELANKFMENRESIQKLFNILGSFAVKIFDFMAFLGEHTWILKTIAVILAGLGAVSLWGSIVAGITAMTAAMATLGITSNLALGGLPLIIGGIAMALTALALNWGKVANGTKKAIDVIVNAVKSAIEWVSKFIDKLGVLAYLIPGLNAIKISKDIAGAVRGKTTNNTTNNNTTNNNSTVYNTTNNYGLTPFGNNFTYNN